MLVEYSISFLTKKFLLFSLGMYATIGLVIFGFKFLKTVPVPLLISLIMVFFIAAFVRLLYEEVFIYDSSRAQIDVKKIGTFALISSVITSVFYFLIRTQLGFWGIPLSIAVSKFFISKIKSTIWVKSPELVFYIGQYAKGLYGFYGILGGVAYVLVHYNVFSFNVSFTIACFAALLFGFLYEYSFVYKKELGNYHKIMIMLISGVLSVAATFVVLQLMSRFGFSGPAATICVALGLKTLQTLIIGQMDI